MSKPATRARKGKSIPGQEYLKARFGTSEWQIDCTVDGHRLRTSSGTSDLASAAALALIERDKLWRRVKLNEVEEKHLTLNDAFVRYYDEVAEASAYGKNSQRYQMANILKHSPKGQRLVDLDDPAVNDLVQRLKKMEILPRSGVRKKGAEPRYLSPATINRVLATLAQICKHAKKKWGVEVGPWEPPEHRMQESQGREVFLDKPQARALMREACGHLRPILLLELCTGLRSANLLSIQWEHISLDMGTAKMIQKGDRKLAIGLPDVALALLKRIEPDEERRRGPVFWFGNPSANCSCPRCAKRGEKPSLYHGQPIKSVKRAFAAAAKRAEVQDMPNGRLRFHDLRHTFASFLLEESGDLMVVRDALGHTNIATTQRYAHLLPGRKKQVINAAVAGLEGPLLITNERKIA